RESPLDLTAITLFQYWAQHLWNDFAGFTDNGGIANRYALALDLRLVVQSCHRNRGACYENRVHHRIRSNASSTSHADFNIQQLSGHFLWWILISNCPSRRTRSRAKAALGCQVIDLDDHAIHL